MITLTERELKTALEALNRYYGISGDLLPEEDDNWLQRSPQAHDSATLRTKWNPFALTEAFATIGDSGQHLQLVKTLAVLTTCVLESPRLQGALYTRELFERMKERDYLRLYEFVTSTRDHDEITIRNKTRSIRLNNYYNWFVKDLLEPFLQSKLAKIDNLEEALAELDAPKPVKKGRRASDPRVGILLWGTYQMITDELKLSSPMPNNLCNFLIILLQIQQVLPVSPVIDAFWVRAQLRYIRSRPEKPRFPIQD